MGANTEVHQDQHSVFQISRGWQEVSANYTHFNMYKHLELSEVDKPQPSTMHRQSRVDGMPAPQSRADVIKILSDTLDKKFPIFRDMTLTTMVLDGKSGRMDVWCCGYAADSGTTPIYTWDLLHFFDHQAETEITHV